MKRHPSITFATHPNAPVVVNRYREAANGRRTYNRDPFRAKYASTANAQWMCDTMNRLSCGVDHWYIAA